MMTYTMRTLIMIFFVVKGLSAQTYTFHGFIDAEFENPENWDPEFSEVSDFCCTANIVIDAQCNSYSSITSYGDFVVNQNISFNTGEMQSYFSIFNRGYFETSFLYGNQSHILNLKQFTAWYAELTDCELEQGGYYAGVNLDLKNSVCAISKGEFSPIGEQTDVFAQFETNYS